MEGLLNQLILEHLQLAPLQWGEYRATSCFWVGGQEGTIMTTLGNDRERSSPHYVLPLQAGRRLSTTARSHHTLLLNGN